MKFYKAHNAIASDHLPRLVVLTGLNGSGKTRGLKQLQNADPNGTQYINYQNFAASWDKPTHTSSTIYGDIVLQDMIKDWQDPQREHRRHGVLFNAQAQENNIKESKFGNIRSAFFAVFPEASKLPHDVHANLLAQYPERAKNYWIFFEGDLVSSAYKDACKRSGKPAHCITDDEAINSLDKLLRLKHPLQFDLASMVTAYAEKRNKFFYESCINNHVNRPSLETFRQSNPDPFDHINAILKRLADNETGIFQFEVLSNVPEIPSTYEQLKQLPPSIEIKLRDTKTAELRKFDELSSGEQTLLALATLIYTHQYIQPMRVLYLDEIDASLHPSMIEAMLQILEEQSDNTRIYLATHSASTVALAPEESLFFVADGKANKISRTDALEKLTQGLVTAEGISSIFRSLRGIDQRIIVISEGKNYEYLEPMFKKVGIDKQCHIHKYRSARSDSKGTSELQVLHQLFCDLIDALPKGKKIVFLLDCEEHDKVARWDNKGNTYVKAITLKEISRNPQKRGIENVVPDSLLDKLENELKDKNESIYKKPDDPCRGILRKDLVTQKFIEELMSPNSCIDIKTLHHALSDLIQLCTDTSACSD